MKNSLVIVALVLVFAGTGPIPMLGQDKKAKEKLELTAKKNGAWLGVMLRSVTKELKNEENLKSASGAYIDDVVDDSPAEEAGVQEGDVIVEFNGKEIKSAEDLQKAVRNAGIGKKVSLQVQRGDEKKTLSATLSEQKNNLFAWADAYTEAAKRNKGLRVPSMPLPPSAPRIMKFRSGAGTGVYGMNLMELNDQLGDYFGATEGKGVLVTEVKKESPAEKAGFKAGDVVLRAGKKTIEDAGDFRSVFGAYDKGEVIPCEILRKGEKTTLNLEAAGEEENDDVLFFNGPINGSMRRHGGFGGADVDAFDIAAPEIELDVKALEGNMEELREHMKDLDIQIEDLSGDDKGAVKKRITIRPKSSDDGGVQKKIIIRTDKRDDKDI